MLLDLDDHLLEAIAGHLFRSGVDIDALRALRLVCSRARHAVDAGVHGVFETNLLEEAIVDHESLFSLPWKLTHLSFLNKFNLVVPRRVSPAWAPSLRELRLVACNLFHADFGRLAALNLPRLELLDLAWNSSLLRDSCGCVDHRALWPALKKLVLRGVGMRRAEGLVRLLGAPQLKELSVASNPLSDAGSLAGAAWALEVLDVRFCFAGLESTQARTAVKAALNERFGESVVMVC